VLKDYAEYTHVVSPRTMAGIVAFPSSICRKIWLFIDISCKENKKYFSVTKRWKIRVLLTAQHKDIIFVSTLINLY
jgi:hypothetical protein